MNPSQIPAEFQRDDEYDVIFAALADAPTFATVEAMLEQHAAYVVAGLGNCLIYEGSSRDVESVPSVVDTENGSQLIELWVKSDEEKRGDPVG